MLSVLRVERRRLEVDRVAAIAAVDIASPNEDSGTDFIIKDGDCIAVRLFVSHRPDKSGEAVDGDQEMIGVDFTEETQFGCLVSPQWLLLLNTTYRYKSYSGAIHRTRTTGLKGRIIGQFWARWGEKKL
jgi:hypothetical protein